MARTVHTMQAALREFADKIGGRDVFDEASIALDAGLDYKLTIICTEKDSGYVVAMHRANVNRLNCWNFTKLGHGEWSGQQGEAPASAPKPLNGIAATMHHDEGAFAQCGDCGRYTLNPEALTVATHRCECGSRTGWSGSFKKPGPGAKWAGQAPAVAQEGSRG